MRREILARQPRKWNEPDARFMYRLQCSTKLSVINGDTLPVDLRVYQKTITDGARRIVPGQIPTGYANADCL